MQKYNIAEEFIPKDSRADINEKILSIIESGKNQGISREDIFNSYTGVGGLHGLSFNDFSSYFDYSSAKKEVEVGQFFTPHAICKEVVSLVEPTSYDRIADITCGMGNFFNYFQEDNCYGYDIDRKAVDVAKYLYPNAHIKCDDFRYFKIEGLVDYVFGNPPFNLPLEDTIVVKGRTGGKVLSQFLFMYKSAEILKPAGVLIAIVPSSFLQDVFINKSNLEVIDKLFDFVGQYSLPESTFKQMGVNKFKTKVVCFQRKSSHTMSRKFNGEYTNIKELKNRLDEVLVENKKVASKLKLEVIKMDNKEFEGKVDKYFYEIRTHKLLAKYLIKSTEYLAKYRNQKPQVGMSYDDWFKNHKITEKMVLAYLKKTVSKQKIVLSKEEINFVKTSYGFKMKGYSDATKKRVNLYKSSKWNNYDITTGLANDFKSYITENFSKVFSKKQQAYNLQNTAFSELDRDLEIDNYLRRFSFKNGEGVSCYFNKIQRHDMGLLIQKKYSILAWKMGGGKSAAALSWAKYKPQRNTFIISAAIAINLTWVFVLQSNRVPYVLVKKPSDIDKISKGMFVLCSFDAVSKCEKQLKKYVKMNSNKVNLIFDESDEITNNSAKRTKSVLNVFRKTSRKLLTTGTTTRNNIGEIYSQLELLYNNSDNFMSWSKDYYIESRSKEDGVTIKKQANKYFNKPFPPYTGQTMFIRCFNPSKRSVFGVNKQSQDIYNEQELKDIIAKTIITRTFREIAGDKYTIENVRVRQDNSERSVYTKIIRELDSILPEYFKTTGDTRKDAMLKTMRQLSLLIEATSMPQMFSFYNGCGIPTKAVEIFSIIQANNEKIAIGCTSVKGTNWYEEQIKSRFGNREVFKVLGGVSFKKRQQILKEFEATNDGILICTQQSLKSSVNIPSCNLCIIESLQWNIPKIEQFFFRFIRYNSEHNTRIIFVNYEKTIEVNLLALLMAKERLNDYVKTLEYKNNSEMYSEYDIDLNILNEVITKKEDEHGNINIVWGESKVVS